MNDDIVKRLREDQYVIQDNGSRVQTGFAPKINKQASATIERLTAERDALRAQLTTERHKVSCLREDIRLEREARQIVEEQIEELLKKDGQP